MHKPNSIMIRLDNFETKEEFENSIKKIVIDLLENGYCMMIHYDDGGLGNVSVEFDHDDCELCDFYPGWFTYDEMKLIEDSQRSEE